MHKQILGAARERSKSRSTNLACQLTTRLDKSEIPVILSGMTQTMSKAGKISISLPNDLIYYLDDCIREHHFEGRSEVIAHALRAMRERELETAYAAASQEWDGSEDARIWDSALADGLGEQGPNDRGLGVDR